MPLVVTANDHATLQKLNDIPILSLDCETTGLDWADRPFLVILADKDGEYLFEKDMFYKLSGILLAKEALVFQNAKFDMSMLRREGIIINPWTDCVDIAIMARILKNNHFGAKPYSLAEQAARYDMEKLDGPLKQYIKDHNLFEIRTTVLGEQVKQPRYDWVPKEVMHPYAAMDARITYDLYVKYTEEMDAEDRVVLANEVALTKICHDMEWRGVRVNPTYVATARSLALMQLGVHTRSFHAATGIEFQDKKKVLVPIFEAAGEKIALTPTKQPRLTDKDLEGFTSPVAQIVRDIREQSKFISTYYDNYTNLPVVDEQGCHIVHPAMWLAGTRTGRFSYSNPNLQNIPKEEKSNASHVVRGCFVPRPGRVFVSMDYAQQEYRLMLAYANQRDLITAVMGGADVHQATADVVGISRSQAKTLNFAILYGAGAAKIAAMLGITRQEADKLISKYFSRLSKVESLIHRVAKVAKQRGFIHNWFGRKLYFGWVRFLDPETGKWERFHDAYTAPNHLIQGGGADIIKKAMVNMQHLIDEDCFPVLQIHDQIVYDVKPHAYQRLVEIAQIMNNAFPEKNGMRMKVDVKWSAKSLAERDLIEGYPDVASRAQV